MEGIAVLPNTSRSQVDRILDLKRDITLSSLQQAAALVASVWSPPTTLQTRRALAGKRRIWQRVFSSQLEAQRLFAALLSASGYPYEQNTHARIGSGDGRGSHC
jgi:hypothetical protein